ncbi:MAG TPA: CoA transferase [Dehalococcoidia bacterium]|nr:CoA transferase [Dehalococcoidia bacterium]
MATGLLTDLRVVELANAPGAAYCGKLLADAGAELIAVEPPGGSRLRTLAPFVHAVVAIRGDQRGHRGDERRAQRRLHDRGEALCGLRPVVADDEHARLALRVRGCRRRRIGERSPDGRRQGAIAAWRDSEMGNGVHHAEVDLVGTVAVAAFRSKCT